MVFGTDVLINVYTTHGNLWSAVHCGHREMELCTKTLAYPSFSIIKIFFTRIVTCISKSHSAFIIISPSGVMKKKVRRFELFTSRQGVAPQKTPFFIHTAVTTPDLEYFHRSVRFTEMVIYVFRCVHKIEKNDYQLRHVCPSVCLSVCQHGITRIPLDGFS